MDLIQIISQVGFPIGVAIFTLTRLDKTIAANTAMIGDVNKTVALLLQKEKLDEK